jgi:hypothetical protein
LPQPWNQPEEANTNSEKTKVQSAQIESMSQNKVKNQPNSPGSSEFPSLADASAIKKGKGNKPVGVTGCKGNNNTKAQEDNDDDYRFSISIK